MSNDFIHLTHLYEIEKLSNRIYSDAGILFRNALNHYRQ